MKTLLVVAFLFFAAVASAAPTPKSVKTGKAADPQRYFTYPMDPPPGGLFYPGPMMSSGIVPAPISYQQKPAASINQFLPIGNDEVPQVTLMLSVPAVVPPGTSVTVTVQVANSSPNSGTVLSVSNPVVTSPSAATSPNDAVVIDAIAGSGPSVIDNVSVACRDDDELCNREPPVLGILPFENPKDSPLLIALQEEAIKQQMLQAALVNRKRA